MPSNPVDGIRDIFAGGLLAVNDFALVVFTVCIQKLQKTGVGLPEFVHQGCDALVHTGKFGGGEFPNKRPQLDSYKTRENCS